MYLSKYSMLGLYAGCQPVLSDKLLQNTTKPDKQKYVKTGFSSTKDKTNIITTIYQNLCC